MTTPTARPESKRPTTHPTRPSVPGSRAVQLELALEMPVRREA